MDKEIWLGIMTHGPVYHELDWIGVDRVGQLGVFTAIMDAPVPEVVGLSYEWYMELREHIDRLDESIAADLMTKEDGDFSDWLTYARKGFFAFDFLDVHRTQEPRLDQYDLIARPMEPILLDDLALSDELKRIIPQIDGNFQDGAVKNELIRNA